MKKLLSILVLSLLFSGSAYSTITNKDFLDYKNSASKSEEKKEEPKVDEKKEAPKAEEKPDANSEAGKKAAAEERKE